MLKLSGGFMKKINLFYCFLYVFLYDNFIVAQFTPCECMTIVDEDRESLQAIIEQDCQPYKSLNRGYHKKLQTIGAVMQAKRSLNDGLLPLSNKAKESIFEYLITHYSIDQEKSKNILYSFAQKTRLHPLSINKIDKKIDCYFKPRLSKDDSVDSLFDYCTLLGDDMKERYCITSAEELGDSYRGLDDVDDQFEG